MNFWQTLPRPFYALAPMDDVTDAVFRQVIQSAGAPDVFFTEFASVDGLQSNGREAVLQKLQFTKTELPLIAQVWGLTPGNYTKTAEELAQMGFTGIDINMGCPVKKVVSKGACSALMHNRELAAEIIAATKAGAGRLPVSVKTRVGYKDFDTTWLEFLFAQDLAALTIHCRTVKEESKVPAHWDLMSKVVALRDRLAPHTVLIINGDIKSIAQGKELATQYGVEGVMIGRGIFNNPWLFTGKDVPSATTQLELYLHHLGLFEATWGGKKNPQSLKRFAKVYMNGFAGVSDLRAQIMQCDSVAEIRSVINDQLTALTP